MTAPAINTLEYLRRALSDEQNSAVVSQNADGTLSITVDIGPGPAEIDLEPLQGPTGPPGLPQFPLILMSDQLTDPKDLPFNLTNTNADIGKYFLITKSDANGVILSAAYIWFGTEYRVLHFGNQGPPGSYGVIKPYVSLLGPDNLSTMTWMDGEPVVTEAPPDAGTADDPYRVRFNLSIPQGPPGESCPLFNMPDVSHETPPLTGQLLAYNGNTVTVDDVDLPVWEPTSTGDIVPMPYIVPSSAFSSYSHVDFSQPVTIVTFPVPPCPFDWKPLVWGQIEMHGGTWFQSLPDEIGILVLLGDPDPEVGTPIARGFGNAPRGVVTIIPHCSYPVYPEGPDGPKAPDGSNSIAMTPWNDVGKVEANNSGNESTLYVVLVNEGKAVGRRSRFDFNAHGSSLFVLACPMTAQNQLSPPQYGNFASRTKLTGLVRTS